jgi:hypothetical protein
LGAFRMLAATLPALHVIHVKSDFKICMVIYSNTNAFKPVRSNPKTVFFACIFIIWPLLPRQYILFYLTTLSN